LEQIKEVGTELLGPAVCVGRMLSIERQQRSCPHPNPLMVDLWHAQPRTDATGSQWSCELLNQVEGLFTTGNGV
jgi:hypothetical protein